jgi:hypothetical protein
MVKSFEELQPLPTPSAKPNHQFVAIFHYLSHVTCSFSQREGDEQDDDQMHWLAPCPVI